MGIFQPAIDAVPWHEINTADSFLVKGIDDFKCAHDGVLFY
jgi:hypothetical protein